MTTFGERETVLRDLIAAAGRVYGTPVDDPTIEALFAQARADAEAAARWDVGPVFIGGTPRPQGSKKPIQSKRQKYPSLVESSPHVGNWRTDVRAAVEKLGTGVLVGPLEVRALFTFRRPLDHYVANNRTRPLKPDAPRYCESHAAGDLDKLERAIGDALAGVLWADDDAIVHWDAWKLWGDVPGLELSVRTAR